MAQEGDSGGTLLSLGIEHDHINACLLERIGGAYRLAGWMGRWDGENPAVVPATGGESADLLTLIKLACEHLGADLGRTLWDAEQGHPLVDSPQPLLQPPVSQVFCLASPLPRLRVGLACLTNRHREPVMDAILSSPSRVVTVYPMQSQARPAQVAAELVKHECQVLVVVGGYDSVGPDRATGAGALFQLMLQARQLMDRRQPPPLIYAGNRWEAPRATGDDGSVVVLDNVVPHPDRIRPAALARALHKIYWERCRQSPQISYLTRWTASATPIEGIDWGFAQLVRLWMEYQRLPSLHGLYCGSNWWLHVWLRRRASGADLQIQFTEPGRRPTGVRRWPPLQLVSGEWPDTLWPRPSPGWHDPLGLAPLVAAIGQVNPVAALEVLMQDLIQEIG